MRRVTAIIAAALLTTALLLVPQPARATGATATGVDGQATPDLIDRARAAGSLSEADGLRQLAYALFRPDRLAPEFRSETPWRGTLPLLQLQEEVADLPDGPLRHELVTVMRSADSGENVQANAEVPPDNVSRRCQNFSAATSNVYTTDHFYLEYDAADLSGSDLTAADYATSLETSWSVEIGSFGWPTPPVGPDPAPGNRIHVRLEPLGGSQLGFTTSDGRHAGFVGDNPNTPWAEPDALASCIVLSTNYDDIAGQGETAQQVLDATTSHELNHAIQIGLGTLTGDNRPDLAWTEGLSTWIEDEVFDGANYAEGYLWPDFDESLGEYGGDDPYALWIAFRGMTERYGTTNAGGSEDVYEEFWERVSQFGVTNAGRLMLEALDAALATRGSNLPQAFHDYAIAAKFVKSCNGGYAQPHCFEEATRYVADAGIPPVHRSLLAVGQNVTGTIDDNYAISWVAMPTTGGPYRATLSNTAASGAGQHRGSLVCDTGSGFRIVPFPSTVTGGSSTTIPSFDPAGCSSVVAVLTNQAQTAANPGSSTARGYRVATGAPSVLPSWRGGVVRGNQWFLRDVNEPLPSGVANVSFLYGDPGDVPLMCDWDGDGLRTPGIRRGITFYLRDSNSTGPATRGPIPFGNPGDVPVCGDWDGDGIETVGVVRGFEWFLRSSSGTVDHLFYGDVGDVPVVGDWDGNGDTDIGIRRGITFYLRTGSGGGVADIAPFAYGDPGDIPFASDPDRDGRHSVGVHRRGQWFLRSPAATSFYGDVADRPVIWFVPGG